MSEEAPQNSNQTSVGTSSRWWPWGQIGWCLAGLALCFTGLGEIAALLQNRADLAENEGLKAIGGLLILGAVGCSMPAVLLRRRARQRGESLSHLPWLRKVNYGLLITAIMLVMLSVIVPAMSAARTAQSRALADGPWKDHPFAEGRYRISAPANWEIHPDPAASKSALRLVDRQNDLHLIANAIPKQDLAARTLADLSQLSVQVVTQGATEVTVGDPQPVEINGSPALDLALMGNFNGVNLVFGFRHVDDADAWVELRFWATRSQFAAHEATFSRIASSIWHVQ